MTIPEGKRKDMGRKRARIEGDQLSLKLFDRAAPPDSVLQHGKTRNNLDQLRHLFDSHGFRTSMISSPRAALSLYKDSFGTTEGSDEDCFREGKQFLVTLFGMHPDQSNLEKDFASLFKRPYCLLLFCKRVREACHRALENKDLTDLLTDIEKSCRRLATISLQDASRTAVEARCLSETIGERVASIIQSAVKADPRLRVEQLQHEYDRIDLLNSTLSNAYVQLFMDAHDCIIKDVFFKHSSVQKFERITVYTFDTDVDKLKPPRFLFMPSLSLALTNNGGTVIADQMVASFWSALLRRGYFVTEQMKRDLEPGLKNYFLSGLTKDRSLPLQL
jgi:hypothetical protein